MRLSATVLSPTCCAAFWTLHLCALWCAGLLAGADTPGQCMQTDETALRHLCRLWTMQGCVLDSRAVLDHAGLHAGLCWTVCWTMLDHCAGPSCLLDWECAGLRDGPHRTTNCTNVQRPAMLSSELYRSYPQSYTVKKLTVLSLLVTFNLPYKPPNKRFKPLSACHLYPSISRKHACTVS